ncbi:MAG TPA: histidinol-phosphate transaminase [Chitinophagales bacterium]|nr:histidinol-phosphate transaminase [Chitinophagales bacterium]
MSIDIQSLVCPHILKMNAYSSARVEYTGSEGAFLDANENSFGSVTDTLHNRYPDPLQMEVKIKIAEQEQVLAQQIFLGNGSDECIGVLMQTFCIPGKDKVMVLPPTFAMYEHAAHVSNIELVQVLLKEETFQLNVAAMLEVIETEKNLKLIFICSPNNPTGNIIAEDDIETILKNFTGLVVIDEAYQDFSTNISWNKRLNDFKNLVVINTFSKSWGMANARLGMLYANEQIIQYMNTIKMPYNVNQHTIDLALQALSRRAIKNNFVQQLVAGREWLELQMKSIPLIHKIYPSDTNYILFKVDDADKLYKYLLTKKVIIRNRDKAPLLKGCLRVSVGTPEENQKFIDALKSFTE